MSSILRFLRDESGATAIEYGLIAALIVLAATGAMMSFANQMNTMYGIISGAMATAG